MFDAPDTYLACTRRLRSNTPLQALTLLNDEAFLEIAEGLTTRLLAHPGDENAKLKFGFRCCVAREPKAAELDRLKTLLAAERSASNPATAEHAAWLSVARVFLNSDETITRE